ncbi:hypothetical protein LSH36_696g01066 [Paralvinella palmiformis]|uniref:Uncharacterized protein n=1 Tax=Paralvinella palmiformis TaxID=53620 RepID=A0AAD9J274_9ANNE|nr:hypothetical protein LSH36_696g01066 [Paralvinella palmiformis]
MIIKRKYSLIIIFLLTCTEGMPDKEGKPDPQQTSKSSQNRDKTDATTRCSSAESHENMNAAQGLNTSPHQRDIGREDDQGDDQRKKSPVLRQLVGQGTFASQPDMVFEKWNFGWGGAEPPFPPDETFYSNLSGKQISVEDYAFERLVCDGKALPQRTTIEVQGSVEKKTGVMMELLTYYDMHFFIKKGRGSRARSHEEQHLENTTALGVQVLLRSRPLRWPTEQPIEYRRPNAAEHFLGVLQEEKGKIKAVLVNLKAMWTSEGATPTPRRPS